MLEILQTGAGVVAFIVVIAFLLTVLGVTGLERE